MITSSDVVKPLGVEAPAVAANMCPHCHAPIGTPHKDGCRDGPGLVGMHSEPVYTAQ
ncbi:hypothetical protein G3A43_08720 [Paraburkholderia aspalathi]|nr:hypothetical protein [Paraburkholderia aspalathi]MBK3780340.1 hypothetical protein [Paraburkholderia aspalathi]